MNYRFYEFFGIGIFKINFRFTPMTYIYTDTTEDMYDDAEWHAWYNDPISI